MDTQFVIRKYDEEHGVYLYYTAGLKLNSWSSNPSHAQAYTMKESAVNRKDTLARMLAQKGKYPIIEVVPVKVSFAVIDGGNHYA